MDGCHIHVGAIYGFGAALARAIATPTDFWFRPQFEDERAMNFEDNAGSEQPQDEVVGVGPRPDEIVAPSTDNVVTLPNGASLEGLSVQGRDLVVTLEDGSRIVIPEGAVLVPQLVIDGVAIPPQTVAQLLADQGPEPAAGPLQSSGGNFATDEGEIQSAFALGDLLPFGEFNFPVEEEEEIFPTLGDEDPTVAIQTPESPIPTEDKTAIVDEAGLPSRGTDGQVEPEGTDESSDSEITTGTIIFSAPDGLASVSINGQPITLVGQTISTPLGTLTITDINLAVGEIGFSYTLDDNTLGSESDVFNVVVEDVDGDQAQASLTIDIIDDAPIAADDIDFVPAGSHAPITGDVLVNDVPGADDYAVEGAVAEFGNDGGTAAPGDSLQGEFGTLTLNSDGTYSYVRDVNTPGGVTDTFAYSIVDQDGSTSTATLVIEIGDAPDAITSVPQTGDGTVVEEGGLPARGAEPAGTGELADDNAVNNSDPSETTGSTITFSSPDGIASVTLGGVEIVPGNLPQTLIDNAVGTLVVTGFAYDPLTGDGSIDYEFTLADNTSGDDSSFDFEIVVVDLDGDVASDTLTINVIDDEPAAEDDSASQVEEDAPVTIDVFANDTPGADDVALGTVTVVEGSLTGAGTLVNNGDGTFTYTPAPGEEGVDGGEQGPAPITFDYTITDGDGDVSTATATITLLEDSTPEIGINEPGVEGEDLVNEAGLPARGAEPAGSDEASDSEIATGIIAIETGNDSVGSLVINGVDVTGGGTITTAKGDLVVALVDGIYSYTYTLADNTLSDPDSDNFALTVTDSDGDTASTTLVIFIADDSPTALDDSNSIGAGEFGPAEGNVLVNDTQGADGATVTGFSGEGGSADAGGTLAGEFGNLTLNADGSYSYIRNPETPGGVSDTFTYTLTDGDGDTSIANLVITIADAPTTLSLPVAGEGGTQVDEAGLAGPPAGSIAASDSEFTTGTFVFTAPDGPAQVTIGGVAVSNVGQTFTGAFGILTIDAITESSITYTYELTTNTDGDNTSDDFVVRVSDQDGDFSEDTLEIAIVDDTPSANPDSDSVTEDGPLIADGNVLTGKGGSDTNTTDGVADITGADGATVTAIAFGTSGGTVGNALAGAYGSLTLNADGSYSYELDNLNATVQGLDSTETLTEVFTYTITDGDGDTATTTLTVTINGQDDPVVLNGLDVEGAELFLDEDDLPDGSSPNSAALTKSGTFTVTSQDGLASLTVGGIEVIGSGVNFPVTIDDPVYGLLTITGVTPVTDADGDIVSATVAYTYVLQDNSLLHSGADDGEFTDSFAVVATDTDGSIATDSLDITIVDDTPSANPDSDSVTEDGPLIADGNVLTGSGGSDANPTDGVADIAGADGSTVTAIAFGATGGTVGNALAGAYGSLTLNADGSYSYQLDNNNPLVQGLDSTETLTEVFAYTITDGDGDTAATTLTITINGSDDGVTINGLDLDPAELTVDEDDLPDGSSPNAAELTQTGSFTIVGQDGLALITAGGITVWTDTGGFVAGQTITTAIGSFVITGVTPTTTDANGDVTEATVTFSYTLNDNTLTHSAAGQDAILESFAITASDTDGSSESASVDVLVIDDIPDVVAADVDAPVLVTEDSDIGAGASDADNFAVLFSTEFGADGAAAADAIVYSLSINGGDGEDSGLDDALTGQNILLRLNGDTVEGYLEASGEVAFTLALNSATGSIVQTQLRAIEHDDPSDPEETEASDAAETISSGLINLTATVTDGDDDTDSQTIDISGSFAFEDDGPDAVDDNASQVTENAAFTIDALDNDAFGADNVDTADPAKVFVSTQASQGTVTYDPITGLFTYTPDAGAGSNGSTADLFEYTIVDRDGDTSTARVAVTLQPDSEPQGGEEVATVDDDGLVGNNPLSTIGDLDANQFDDPSDTSEATFTGTLSFDVGNDTPATISFAPVLNGATATVGQETVAYSVVGNVLTATVTGGVRDGTALFTVEITDTATGAYVVTLLDNVLHTRGDDENNAFASIDFTVADSEGDTTLTNLGIVFDDDAPTATDNSATVIEGGMTGGNALSDDQGSGVDASGADGFGLNGAIIRIDSVNAGGNQTTVDASGNLILAGEFGTLTINVNTGVYNYASDANATNSDVQDVFTYTIVDGDGDEATATLTINIENVAGQVSDNDVLVDEAGLSIGSDPTSDSEIDADGQISVTGASGTLVYSLTGAVAGPGANEVQIDGAFGTIVLNTQTGAYTYTLDTPFTDTVDENGPNVVNGVESFEYVVTDTLGNEIGRSTIDVSIIDDVPTATDQANINVAEDAVGTIGGNVVTDGTGDTPGADGASVTAITIGGNTTAVPQDGSSITVFTANGTYTIDQNGEWTFDPNPNLDHSAGNIDASFTYTLTDGDGDFDTAIQPITIVDGAGPMAGPDITLALDDQNLADGSTPGAPDFDSDTITFTPGTDDIASIVFGDTSALGGGLNWVRVSDTQITGSDSGRLVVTLDLSVTNNVATVTATLNDNFDDHPIANVDDLVDLGDVDVIATDIDGDTASATVSVSVSDDLPTITASAPAADALTVDETDLTTDATADFSGLFTADINADNPGTVGDYVLGINAGVTGLVDVATGEAVQLRLNGDVVEGFSATGGVVFTVAVDSDGMVTLDQQRAIRHDDGGDPNDAAVLSAANLVTLSATVTDSDGDTDTAVANIAGAFTFLDDGPDAVVSNAVADMLILDESPLPPDGDGIRSAMANLADNFGATIDFGADGAGSVSYALLLSANGIGSGLFALGANGAQGDEILLSLSGDTVTGSVGGTDYFTIAVDTTAGELTFIQLENIWQGDDSEPDDLETLTLDGAGEFLRIEQTVTDRDNDSDSATVELGSGVFKIEDDGPSVSLSGINPDLLVSDADLSTDASLSFAGAFTFDAGTDEELNTDYALGVVDGTATGIFDTATGNQVFLFLESGVVVGREGSSTGNIVFTVTVASNGTVELDQLRAVDHMQSNLDGANATLIADDLVQLTATITDRDGDTDSATLNIGSDLLFADDTPTAAVTQTAFLDDDTQSGGNAGGPDDQDPDEANLTGTLVDPVEGFGADGGTVAFATTGAPAGFQYVASGSDILIQQAQGNGLVTVVTVTLDPNTGNYTVTQNANILHADDGNNDENEQTFTLSATLTDGDGDTDTTSLTIVVDDDTPISADGNSSGTVDEDGLDDGIEGGTGDVVGTATVATGSVTGFFSSGADTPLAYSLDTDTAALESFTSGGVAVSYEVNGNTLTASAGVTPIFTLVLNATTGQWTFTLHAPLDHAPSGGENDLFFNFADLIVATDADGDEVSSEFAVATVRINDDTPVAVDDSNALSEDDISVGGNILTDPVADGFGADGPGTTAITEISGSGGSGTVGGTTTGSFGILTLGADGTYSYVLNQASVQHLDDGETETDTFNYTIIDADGDTSSATLTITINGANDAPFANADTNFTIEDAASAISGNVLQTIAHNGAPDGNARGDVADTDVDIEPLTVTTVGSFSGTYGVLTLNSDGSYSYRLFTEVENPTAFAAVQALNEGDAPLSDVFNYTASDGDLTADSTLTIDIFGANDAPVVGTATVATSDEGLMGGLTDSVGSPSDTTNSLTANGTISITDTDDTSFTVTLSAPSEALSSGGETIVWSLSPDGQTLTGSTTSAGTVLTIVISDTGAFTVTQSAQIDHPDTTSEDVVSFGVDVNVNDGTTTTTQIDAITVNLEDDGPEAVVADSLSATNAAGTLASVDLDLDDDVDNNFGGDGGRVIFTANSIASLEAQGLTSGFIPLEYSISADGTVLTAVKAGTTDTVFTLTLDPNSAEDDYVLNLVQEIDSTTNVQFNDTDFNFTGGNLSWTGFVSLDENLGGTPVDNDSQDLLLTPAENGADAGSVNTTANIGGVSNGASVGNGETFRVDFVTDLRGDPADTVGGQDYAAAANRDHVFDGHYLANGATALFKSTNGSQVRITAFDDTDGDNDVGDGVIDAITGVTIEYRGVSNGTIIIPTTTPTVYSVNGRDFTVTLNADGSVSVDGLEGDSGSSLAGTVIGVFTDDGYNSLEYTYESGGTFQIGGFGATVISNDPVEFDVPISVVDNDGDIVSSGVLDITLSPSVTPVVLDLDGDGVEFVPTSAGVAFDYSGDGSAEATAWAGADDAILAIDTNGDGTVSNASEFVFGGNDQTDLEAIAALYDDNDDGILDSSDSAFSRFGVWRDANQNGVSEAGEFVTLAQAGIVSINLDASGTVETAAGGDVTIFGTTTFTYADGSTGVVADTAFATGAVSDNQQTRANQRAAEIATVAALASSVLIGAEAGLGLSDHGMHLRIEHQFDDGNVSTSAFAKAPKAAVTYDELISNLLLEQQTDFLSPVSDSILGNSDAANALADLQKVAQFEPSELATAELFEVGDAISTESSPSAFAGIEVAQAMEALLVLEAAQIDREPGLDTVEGVLTDLAAENLLDQVIDQFEDQSDSIDYLASEEQGEIAGLLNEVLDAAVTPPDASQALAQQLEDAAAAAAQA